MKDNPYERVLELHNRVEGMYGRVNALKVFMRASSQPPLAIPRPPQGPHGLPLRLSALRPDRVVCGLAIKAATTKRSIAKLCDDGDGDNALVLARVLLENAATLEWLTRERERHRLELYELYLSPAYERVVSTIRQFEHRFRAAGAEVTVESDPYHQAVAESLFGSPQGDRATWQLSDGGRPQRVTAKRIFDEIATDDLSFEYAILYGELGSEVVHSGPFAANRVLRELGSNDYFTVRALNVDDGCTIALAVSNMAMMLVLESMNTYATLGLDDELATLKAELLKKPSAEGDE